MRFKNSAVIVFLEKCGSNTHTHQFKNRLAIVFHAFKPLTPMAQWGQEYLPVACDVMLKSVARYFIHHPSEIPRFINSFHPMDVSSMGLTNIYAESRRSTEIRAWCRIHNLNHFPDFSQPLPQLVIPTDATDEEKALLEADYATLLSEHKALEQSWNNHETLNLTKEDEVVPGFRQKGREPPCEADDNFIRRWITNHGDIDLRSSTCSRTNDAIRSFFHSIGFNTPDCPDLLDLFWKMADARFMIATVEELRKFLRDLTPDSHSRPADWCQTILLWDGACSGNFPSFHLFEKFMEGLDVIQPGLQASTRQTLLGLANPSKRSCVHTACSIAESAYDMALLQQTYQLQQGTAASSHVSRSGSGGSKIYRGEQDPLLLQLQSLSSKDRKRLESLILKGDLSSLSKNPASSNTGKSKFCELHGSCSHSTSECRVLKSQNSAATTNKRTAAVTQSSASNTNTSALLEQLVALVTDKMASQPASKPVAPAPAGTASYNQPRRPPQGTAPTGRNNTGGGRPHCSSCDKPGHTADRCFVDHPELALNVPGYRGPNRETDATLRAKYEANVRRNPSIKLRQDGGVTAAAAHRPSSRASERYGYSEIEEDPDYQHHYPYAFLSIAAQHQGKKRNPHRRATPHPRAHAAVTEATDPVSARLTRLQARRQQQGPVHVSQPPALEAISTDVSPPTTVAAPEPPAAPQQRSHMPVSFYPVVGPSVPAPAPPATGPATTPSLSSTTTLPPTVLKDLLGNSFSFVPLSCLLGSSFEAALAAASQLTLPPGVPPIIIQQGATSWQDHHVAVPSAWLTRYVSQQLNQQANLDDLLNKSAAATRPAPSRSVPAHAPTAMVTYVPPPAQPDLAAIERIERKVQGKPTLCVVPDNANKRHVTLVHVSDKDGQPSASDDFKGAVKPIKRLLLDTGANISLLSDLICALYQIPYELEEGTVNTSTGDAGRVIGRIPPGQLWFSLMPGTPYETLVTDEFFVASGVESTYDVLMGMGAMSTVGMSINFTDNSVTFPPYWRSHGDPTHHGCIPIRTRRSYQDVLATASHHITGVASVIPYMEDDFATACVAQSSQSSPAFSPGNSACISDDSLTSDADSNAAALASEDQLVQLPAELTGPVAQATRLLPMARRVTLAADSPPPPAPRVHVQTPWPRVDESSSPCTPTPSSPAEPGTGLSVASPETTPLPILATPVLATLDPMATPASPVVTDSPQTDSPATPPSFTPTSTDLQTPPSRVFRWRVSLEPVLTADDTLLRLSASPAADSPQPHREAAPHHPTDGSASG